MEEPIRILHVVTYMGRGGLETMLMNYYRNIDRKKIQFDFLVHRDFEADYDAEILSLGGKIFHVSRLNPFSPHYYKELDVFFKNHPAYKIVHVHQDCLSSIALKVAMKNHIPVRIAHSHSSSQDKNFKFLIKKYFMKSIPDYATHLFACGKEAGDWMFNGKSYQIVNNAIDTNLYVYNEEKRNRVRLDLGLNDELVIGHVGRFNYPKNHDFLIDVFNEIHKKDSNTKLLLVGSGDLEEKIKKKVNELGLCDQVLFLGSRNDVNELMQAMDVFVFPSHYEGIPVTLIEAQTSGLPIFISSNVPSQCKLTPNVTSVSLEKNAGEWADVILKNIRTFIRKDMSSYIKDAGYDIQVNAKWLEGFYLSEVKKYE